MKYQDRINRGRVRSLEKIDQVKIQGALNEIHSNIVQGLQKALL